MYISCIHDISHGFCHSSSEHAEACTSVTHGQYIAHTASVTQVVNMQKRVLLSLMDRCELLTQKKKSLCSQVRQGTNMELKRTLIRSLNVTKKNVYGWELFHHTNLTMSCKPFRFSQLLLFEHFSFSSFSSILIIASRVFAIQALVFANRAYIRSKDVHNQRSSKDNKPFYVPCISMYLSIQCHAHA